MFKDGNMDDSLDIDIFNFSESAEVDTKNIDSEYLTQKIFNDKSLMINSLPLSKAERIRLMDIQNAIFEFAKLNKAIVCTKFKYDSLIYCVKIESREFNFVGYELSYIFEQIFSVSTKVIIKNNDKDKISIYIFFGINLNDNPNDGAVRAYSLTSNKKIKLSKYTITKMELKNVTYGSYPVHIQILFKISGENRFRDAYMIMEKPLGKNNIKIVFPEEKPLDITNEDHEEIKRNLWEMYCSKAYSEFYNRKSIFNQVKTVSVHLKYLRWREGLSLFKAAKFIGLNPITLFRFEKCWFKNYEVEKINFEFLKNTYGIEKYDLLRRERFVKAVNFEFLKDGYLK